MPTHASPTDPAGFWDGVYRARGVEGVSWFQAEPATSLELVAALDVPPSAAVLDVGAGASLLVDGLVERGFEDVTVLDVSEEALGAVSRRLPSSSGVHLERADLLAWAPRRCYDLWHDRAVFHFLVGEADRRRYLDVLRTATTPSAAVVLGTFAPDAPDKCSGLSVVRYSAEDLAQIFGDAFELVEARREEHVTPRGAVQPFTWVAGRMRA